MSSPKDLKEHHEDDNDEDDVDDFDDDDDEYYDEDEDEDEDEILSDLSDLFEEDSHLLELNVDTRELTLDDVPFDRDLKYINVAGGSGQVDEKGIRSRNVNRGGGVATGKLLVLNEGNESTARRRDRGGTRARRSRKDHRPVRTTESSGRMMNGTTNVTTAAVDGADISKESSRRGVLFDGSLSPERRRQDRVGERKRSDRGSGNSNVVGTGIVNFDTSSDIKSSTIVYDIENNSSIANGHAMYATNTKGNTNDNNCNINDNSMNGDSKITVSSSTLSQPLPRLSPFNSDITRIKIIYRMLEDPQEVGGLELRLTRMLNRVDADTETDLEEHIDDFLKSSAQFHHRHSHNNSNNNNDSNNNSNNNNNSNSNSSNNNTYSTNNTRKRKDKPHKHLQKKNELLAGFPLHNPDKLLYLRSVWFDWNLTSLPWRQPIHDIKDYFGEQIALYYAFLGHFSFCLSIPAIVGLVIQIIVIINCDINSPIIPFYSLFIVLWGVGFLEFWKRKESYIALQHGMLNFKISESYRAEFEESEIVNLTGEKILYFPIKKRFFLVLQSFCILFALCVCVIGTVASIYILRNVLAGYSKEGSDVASIIASVLNSISIQFYGYIYALLSSYLTDRENHKTQTEYEDCMIAKTFVFSFINSYASFFYIAFFASFLPRVDYPNMPADAPQAKWKGQCGAPSCFETLAINLGIVLLTSIVVTNSTDIILPYFSELYQTRHKSKSITPTVIINTSSTSSPSSPSYPTMNTTTSASPQTSSVTDIQQAEQQQQRQHQLSLYTMIQAEKEYYKVYYSEKDVLNDYMSIVISFGYMTMFVSALPAAAFVVFLALWIAIKGDSWRLVKLSRRPWPKGIQSIGTWQHIFELLITSSVITNAALIVFTMNVMADYSAYFKFWVFIGFQWVVFTLQYLIRFLIPDVPIEVQIQQQRANFINKRLIDRELPDTNNLKLLLQSSSLNNSCFGIDTCYTTNNDGTAIAFKASNNINNNNNNSPGDDNISVEDRYINSMIKKLV